MYMYMYILYMYMQEAATQLHDWNFHENAIIILISLCAHTDTELASNRQRVFVCVYTCHGDSLRAGAEVEVLCHAPIFPLTALVDGVSQVTERSHQGNRHQQLGDNIHTHTHTHTHTQTEASRRITGLMVYTTCTCRYNYHTQTRKRSTVKIIERRKRRMYQLQDVEPAEWQRKFETSAHNEPDPCQEPK